MTMSTTKPKSRIFLRESVVFEVGSNLYNEEDVEQCVANIAAVASGLEKFILLSIPDKSNGITPAAAEQAVGMLKEALHESCAAILILTANTSAKILAHALEEHGLTQQLYCSESLMELFEKAEGIMDKPDLFMDVKR